MNIYQFHLVGKHVYGCPGIAEHRNSFAQVEIVIPCDRTHRIKEVLFYLIVNAYKLGNIYFRLFQRDVSLPYGGKKIAYVFSQKGEVFSEKPRQFVFQKAGIHPRGTAVHVLDIEDNRVRIKFGKQKHAVSNDAAAPGPGSHLGNGQIIYVQKKDRIFLLYGRFKMKKQIVNAVVSRLYSGDKRSRTDNQGNKKRDRKI